MTTKPDSTRLVIATHILSAMAARINPDADGMERNGKFAEVALDLADRLIELEAMPAAPPAEDPNQTTLNLDPVR